MSLDMSITLRRTSSHSKIGKFLNTVFCFSVPVVKQILFRTVIQRGSVSAVREQTVPLLGALLASGLCSILSLTLIPEKYEKDLDLVWRLISSSTNPWVRRLEFVDTARRSVKRMVLHWAVPVLQSQ